MMYPAQTSFIPVIVAIVRFTEEHGFGGLYPFWYLGSTPVKYLTGPVVPSLLTALHKVLGGVSLFDLSFFLILTSFLVSSVGWGMLAWQLSGRRIYCYIENLYQPFTSSCRLKGLPDISEECHPDLIGRQSADIVN